MSTASIATLDPWEARASSRLGPKACQKGQPGIYKAVRLLEPGLCRDTSFPEVSSLVERKGSFRESSPSGATLIAALDLTMAGGLHQ